MTRFPKPWYSIWCGDAYRIVDANYRHLFDISSDEFAFGDEDANPETGTVFEYGAREEREALCKEIEQLFPDEEQMAEDNKRSAWCAKIEELIHDITDDHDDLAVLDHNQYWDRCYDDGLTPQQACDPIKQQIEKRRIS